MFAATNAGVFLSTDAGATWNPINTGLPNLSVQCLLVDGSDLYAGMNPGGVFISTDLGNSWNEANTGLTGQRIRALVAHGQNIFLANESGIWRSDNRGQEWVDVSDGLPPRPAYSLAVVNDNLVAGTYGFGVWLRPLAEIVTSAGESAPPLPAEIFLEQNYPNPFNPVTRIAYTIPQGEPVRLSVYNALGQLVKELERGYRGSGRHVVEWDASTMPSGVYCYQLRAGGHLLSRKMMLIR